MDETKDWIANARQGVSRREFMAGAAATGVGLAGFAIAAGPVAGQVITTSTEGLAVGESKVASGDFQVPIYEARPAGGGQYPVVLVVPEIWGMHEHIKDAASPRRDSLASPSSRTRAREAFSRSRTKRGS